MKLADLRKLAIREQARIHFHLPGGLECVVNPQGVAQVPGLRHRPEFNLEAELASAVEFLLEPGPPLPARKLRRSELEAMAASTPAAAGAHDHDDE